ncbi:hypothetical protein AB0D11_45900 [Streptomyces monashensis]|uniref:hypothetical protein n=1 Tax=Streptomyces monashensis TaxID=1678012 RepID=UPI00340D763F
MSTARKPRRRCLRALALAAGAFAAVQIAGAPLAQATALHTPTRAHAAAVRAGQAITCERVQADGPTIFGQQCDSGQWGPVSDFVVVARDNNASYACRSGWAEGTLWVQGQDCRRISSGG